MDRPKRFNGRLEHLRGSALGFRDLTNYIARSLLETDGFRPRLHPSSVKSLIGEPNRAIANPSLAHGWVLGHIGAMTNTIMIPPKDAKAIHLRRGQRLRIVDVEGDQVADLVAFDASNPRESFSQSFTRMNNEKASVDVGDSLFSNRDTPLLSVTADSVGVHDMLFPPCNRFMYRYVYGIEDKTGCREHLAAALEPFGIGFELVTDPFNVFMHTCIEGESGRMRILPPKSAAGDFFEVRAEVDLVVGVSACAADITDCNGGRCTAIEIRVEG